jgi:hypothetical protein
MLNREFRPGLTWTAMPAYVLAPILWIGLVATFIPFGSILQTGGDEGMELIKAMILNQQPQALPNMWNDQPLTLTKGWSILFSMTNLSAGPPRAVVLLFSGLLMGSLSGIAYHIFGSRIAAWTAAIYLAVCPLFLYLSISVMQELPGIALSYAAIWVLVSIRTNTPIRYLLLAGFLMGFAIAIKLTMAVYLLAGVLLLFARMINNKQSTGAQPALEIPKFASILFFASLFVLTSAALAAAILWLNDDWRMESLLGTHARAALQSLPDSFLSEAGSHLLSLFFIEGKLIAIFGALYLFFRPSGDLKKLSLSLIPLMTGVLFLLVVRPYWPFYSIYLWAAMALPASAAGNYFSRAFSHFRDLFDKPPNPARMPPLIGSLVLAGLLVSAVGKMLVEINIWRNTEKVLESGLIAGMKRYAEPGQVIFSENPIFAFHARILVPPELAVLSHKRFLIGDITAETIGGIIAESQCKQIVLSSASERLPDYLPRFEEEYVLVGSFHGFVHWVHKDLNPEQQKQLIFRW